MSSDGVLVLQAIFGSVWRLFTSWYIPGTSVTPGMMLVFLAFAGIVWRVIRSFNGSIRSPSSIDRPVEPVADRGSSSSFSSGSSLSRR